MTDKPSGSGIKAKPNKQPPAPPQQPRGIAELKKSLCFFKGRNTAIQKFLSIYQNKPLEVDKVTSRIEKYKESMSTLQEICEQMEQADPNNEHHTSGVQFEIEANYFDNIAEFERLLAVHRGDQTRSNSVTRDESVQRNHHNFSRRRLRLPESSLPSFNGDFENWLSFKGEFEATIHNEEDLSKVDKLSYLRRCLTGSALDKIKMIAIAEDNYDRAWEILNDMYQNQRLIISRHYKLMLTFPRQTSETATGLTKLVDDTRQHVEMLKMVGVIMNDETIVALVENALAPVTSDAWEETLKKGEFPKSKTLLEFLSQRAARFLVRDGINQRNENKSDNNSNKQGMKRPHAKAFYTASDVKCSVCNQEHHPLFKCKKFRSLNVEGRIQIVKQHSYCSNCLRKGHVIKDCQSKHMCWVCEGRHNTLIHTSEEESTSKQD